MKRHLPYTCFLSLCVSIVFFSACKQKKEICCYNVLYIRPIGLGLVGYDSTEVTNISIWSFKANTNFLEPLDTFRIMNGDYEYDGDTVTVNSAEWPRLNPGTDYVVKLKDAVIHTITGITSPPSERHCFESEHCSPGSLQARIADVQNVHVDGVMAQPGPYYGSFPMIYLTK